jgi:hypothetical protein
MLKFLTSDFSGDCCGEDEEMSEFTAGGHSVAADLPIGSPGRAAFFNGSTGGQKGRPRKRKTHDPDMQGVGLQIPPVLGKFGSSNLFCHYT